MRTLFLAPRVPYPPNRGDRIRSWNWLRYFARRGPVDLACTTDEPLSPSVQNELRNCCDGLIAAPAPRIIGLTALAAILTGRSVTEGAFYARRIRDQLREWCRERRYDLVFVYCSSMFPYLEDCRLERDRILVDLVDVDSRKWQDYSAHRAGIRSLVYRWESNRVRKLERRASAGSRRLLVTSELEAEIAREIVGPGRVAVVGNGVDLDYFAAVSNQPYADRPTCVFTGTLDYHPNTDGLCWFVEHVWSRVRKAVADARLLIVGRSPNRAVRSLKRTPGVELRADVPDVRPSLAESRAVIAPLRIARGIQNKVLEGMAARRPVIASSFAAAGTQARPGYEFIQADDVAEWTAALIRLFRDDSYGNSIAAAGRRYVERRHDWSRQFELLDPLVDAIVTASATSGHNRNYCEAATGRSG